MPVQVIKNGDARQHTWTPLTWRSRRKMALRQPGQVPVSI